MPQRRVVIAGGGTGGHLMPALAIADALVDEIPDLQVVLVGSIRGVEARLLPGGKHRHQLLPSHPIYRKAVWRNVRWIYLAPALYLSARRLLARERPQVVVGTGGYAAGPVLWAAHRRKIPIVLQEQNALPGITTRIMARYARQIHLGYREAAARLKHPPATEVYDFGNPVRAGATGSPHEAEPVEVLAELPTLFVMGGSQGAHRINLALAEALDSGRLSGLNLLWSTGAGDYADLVRYHDPPRVQVREFWDPVSEAYRAADLVVCRAGAMTTAELGVWGLPSVLIPLPSAAGGHQSYNAKALESAGAAVCLPEEQLTGQVLADQVEQLISDPARLGAIGSAARGRGKPEAAKNIARQIGRLML